MCPSCFRDNSSFLKQAKQCIKSILKLRIKNLQCFFIGNVADDVLFQKHFTDLDYLDWFSRYERFVNMSSNLLAVATADLP